jgi:hypothetical protein
MTDFYDSVQKIWYKGTSCLGKVRKNICDLFLQTNDGVVVGWLLMTVSHFSSFRLFNSTFKLVGKDTIFLTAKKV